jgi:hemerythrin-like domain-containing protein
MGAFSISYKNKENYSIIKDNYLKNDEYPPREISYEFPLDDPNPIMLAKDIYFNKINILGRKRNRADTIKENNKNEKHNLDNKSIILKEENIYADMGIKNGKSQTKIIDDSLIMTEKIKEDKNKNNEKYNKDNKDYIENCLKHIKEENEKFEEMNEKYDKKLKNNILHERFKITFNSEKNNTDENIIYSYECLTNNLYVKGTEGIEQLSVLLNIKNNGNFDWLGENINLICDKEKSDILAEDIQLIPLKSQMTYSAYAIFNYLNLVPPGKYYSYINFNINGKNYGRELKIIIEIIKKIT